MDIDRSFTPGILVVDDEPANVQLLDRLLARAGLDRRRSTTDAREALSLFEEMRPDLVLLDLLMPHLDGVAVLKQLRAAVSEHEYLPVLVLTADATVDAKQRALAAGATDFLTKPFDPTEVILRIKNLLEARRVHVRLDAYRHELEQMVEERTARLLQSEKVAAMGSLLAGVAHELNNPLAIVMGQSVLLQRTAPDLGVRARADKIEEAADRCVRIVRNFLALARQQPPERSAVCLNQVAEGALELLAYELRTDDVAVTRSLAADLPTLWADGHQLHQVVVNLVANAHQAMRGVPRTPGAPRRITVTTGALEGDSRVSLSVADTGPGISPEVSRRVFEPFFTTKPVGQGTGLGLSLCQGIAEEHGGSLRVESEPGAGATFVLTIPVVKPPAAESSQAGEGAEDATAAHSVLVVDDEREIALILAEILSRDGHGVHTAENGADALRQLELTRYDLVLCDTKMPELDGLELFQQIERRFPATRFVFVTGDVLDSEKRRFIERSGVPCVMKPFRPEELRQAVTRALTGTR